MKTKIYLKALLLFSLLTGLMPAVLAQLVSSTSGYYPSEAEYYESLPIFGITPQSAAITLPGEVDNSNSPYFPQKDNTDSIYVYDQKSTAACQNVATTYYTFTYEINRLRNVTSNQQTTRYVPNFTFNHLNHGFSDWQGYTSLRKVHDFLKETGAMNDLEFDGPGENDILDLWRWPSGYEYYYNAMKNKLHSVERFDFSLPVGYNGEQAVRVRIDSNFNNLKHYLYDHGTGNNGNGGLVTIGEIFSSDLLYLGNNSTHAGDRVMLTNNYCHPGGHAMVIVGYCDSIKYDWGGSYYIDTCYNWGTPIIRKVPIPDGQVRNDIDNNGDGIVDMQDWETGAVKVYNSYGPDHETEGYKWIMYCALPFRKPNPPEWWGGNEYYILTPKASFQPQLVLKAEIDAANRSGLKLGCGYSPLANYSTPSEPTNYFTGYNNDGGDYYIQGKDKNGNNLTAPLEVSFDFSYFYWNKDVGKVFLVSSDTSDALIPKLNYFSLVDYRWNEEFELTYDDIFPLDITENEQFAGVEYDLIAQGPEAPPITVNTTFEANMVSRFTPTVTNNSTLTVNDGVRIDMYNSIITIDAGCKLVLGNNVMIRAKRGTNKLIIKGDIQLGENISFEAVNGASFDVIYENIATPSVLSYINCDFINARLVVQAGELSINNSLLTFTSQSKVIVKQASKLSFNDTKLTCNASGQWQGIEVWGTTNQHQFSVSGVYYQGTVELKNGAVIENAANGITNWKPDDWNSIGGIIKAEGAIFKNCRRGVEFMKYRNFHPTSGYEVDNLSYFRNCSFIVDDNYSANASPFYTGVSLWSVRGIKFSGCDFYNNKTVKGSGYGIHSLDAGYKIYAICNSQTVPCPDLYLDKTNIDGFEYGINASNAETYNTINVQNAVFTDNGYGIELLNVNNAVILDNHFEMASATNCPNYGIGINLVNCTGYAIEGNNFASDNIPTNYSWTGIETINSGQAYNEIYKNSYQNLTTGNVADLLNATTNTIPPTGLTYLCNTNTGNKYDFFVTNNADSRISYYQRSGSSTAAGNAFSPNASVNFFNEGASQVRYYYSTGMAPFTYSGIQLILTANANTCPSHYGGGSGIEVELTQSQADALESQYADAYSAYNNVKSIYETLKDGGSTQNTVEEIENSIPSEMWELRAKLLGDSPHLSQQALMEAALKTDVLPESVLFEILAANPDEMRDESFLSFLESKEYPLPSYMIDLLRAIAGNTSYKTVLQEQLNAFNTQKTLAASDIIRSKLNDSIISQTAKYMTKNRKSV